MIDNIRWRLIEWLGKPDSRLIIGEEHIQQIGKLCHQKLKFDGITKAPSILDQLGSMIAMIG